MRATMRPIAITPTKIHIQGKGRIIGGVLPLRCFLLLMPASYDIENNRFLCFFYSMFISVADCIKVKA